MDGHQTYLLLFRDSLARRLEAKAHINGWCHCGMIDRESRAGLVRLIFSAPTNPGAKRFVGAVMAPIAE